MTTAYTSLLGLALPVTGELSGTWGDTVNTAITSLLDTAVAGTTSITTDADITLTTTTGASNQARQAILLWNPASGTTTRYITAPAQSKLYTVINASGGTQSIVIRGAGPTTGVTIAKGESAMVAWNGSDFVKVSSSGGAITFTDLTVTGNTILGDAAADTLTVNATSTFASPVNFTGQVKLPSTGRSAAAALSPTNPAFLYGVASTYTDTTSSGTLSPVASFYGFAQPTLSTSNVTTYTNAATLYIANAPAAGGSATITNPYALYVAAGANYFAGNVTIGGSTTLSAGTGFGIAYLNGSKALTTSASLTFDTSRVSVYGPSGDVSLQIYETSSGNDSRLVITQNGGLSQYNNTYNISSSNAHVFYIGNSELMRLNTTGLGIGTTNPQAKLDVVGNASLRGTTSGIQLDLITTSNRFGVGIDNSTGGNYGSAYSANLWVQGAYPIQFWTSDTKRMTLTANGNLALGVGSATARLDVRTSSAQAIYAYTNGGYNALEFTSDSGTTTGSIRAYSGGVNFGPASLVGGFGGGITVLTSTFRVGINTTVPTTQLDVLGSSGDQLRLNNSGERYTQLTFANNGTSKGAIWVDNTNSLLEYYGYAGIGLTFWSNALERMRITSGGLIGVGTTSPNGNLDVKGSIWVSAPSNDTAVIINNDGTTGVVQTSFNTTGAYTPLQLKTSEQPRLHIRTSGEVIVGGASSDLSATTQMMVLGSGGFAVQYGATTGTYLKVTPGVANGVVSLAADARSGAYPPLTIVTSGTERARFSAAGALLLNGTSDPSSNYKLSITGDMIMPYGANRQIYMGTSSNWGYIQFTSSNEFYLQDLDGNFNFWHASYNSGTKFIEFAGATCRVYSGAVQITGSLSKSSGSFKIDHPIPAMSETHHLVHSFVEAPQADNLYRGQVALVNGMAQVNIDQAAGMTEGTFILLNREVQCFTSNESGWALVRGKVSGNILTIEAQDQTCTDTISWMVIGERQDKHMYDTEWTDDNGKVIVEPLKQVDVIDNTPPKGN